MKSQITIILQSSEICVLFCILILFHTGSLYGQSAPSIQWQRCLGGLGGEHGNAIVQTTDGGYIVAGVNNSTDTLSDVIGNQGGIDAWVVKLNAKGTIEWQRSLGGSGDDIFNCIIQTADGGYIAAGSTTSVDGDGDVIGKHGLYHADHWVVKLSASGFLQWQKCLGGNNDDNASAIVQTPEGGYLIAGSTYSVDGDISGKHEITFNADAWIVKIDPVGNLIWQKCLGGTGDDAASAILLTSEGGCIIAGSTSSTNGDVTVKHGGSDAWIVKLDSSQNIVWQKCYGGSGGEGASSIVSSSDGGYIFAGFSESNDGDVSGSHDTVQSSYPGDGWIVKIDSTGNLLWQRCVGGKGDEVFYSVTRIQNDHFVAAGWSTSAEEGFFNHGLFDALVASFNLAGDLLWQKCYGGSYTDWASSIFPTSDRGLIFTGRTQSNDGDVSGLHGSGFTDPDNDNDSVGGDDAPGDGDIWVVKLNPPPGETVHSLQVNSMFDPEIYPNPAENIVTLEYDLPKSSIVSIQIYNITGQCKFTRSPLKEGIGHHEYSIAVSGFSEGSYIVSVDVDGISERAMMQVVK